MICKYKIYYFYILLHHRNFKKSGRGKQNDHIQKNYSSRSYFGYDIASFMLLRE